MRICVVALSRGGCSGYQMQSRAVEVHTGAPRLPASRGSRPTGIEAWHFEHRDATPKTFTLSRRGKSVKYQFNSKGVHKASSTMW